MVMLPLACLLLLPAQGEPADSSDFSKEQQTAALTATVRVVNVSRKVVGSGVILGRKGPFAYILTACHLVDRSDGLEVATFSTTSYPKPWRLYRSVRLVAGAGDIRDLALLRVVTDDPMPGTLALCPARFVPEGMGFKALSVGCSGGAAPTCQVDEVTGKKLARREAEGKAVAFWEVDRKQQEGRSGGPLVDRRGCLLGVCSGTNKEMSYFCHADEVRAFLIGSGFDWLI
jgi:S1-C subfamily serine protease